MSTWFQRMLPHPLLAPWTDDYANCSFDLRVLDAALNNGQWITVKLQFQLCSDSLESLVADSKAEFVVEVSCPKTFVKETHRLSEEDELVLEADNFSQELSITPYVVSSERLEISSVRNTPMNGRFIDQVDSVYLLLVFLLLGSRSESYWMT